MTVHCFFSLISQYCQQHRKFALYLVRTDESEISCTEAIKAAPFLTFEQSLEADRGWVFFFDTEEELNQHFWQVVGDDGPTALNNYNGPARFYAHTYAPNGEIQTENT